MSQVGKGLRKEHEAWELLLAVTTAVTAVRLLMAAPLLLLPAAHVCLVTFPTPHLNCAGTALGLSKVCQLWKCRRNSSLEEVRTK